MRENYDDYPASGKKKQHRKADWWLPISVLRHKFSHEVVGDLLFKQIFLLLSKCMALQKGWSWAIAMKKPALK